MTVQLFCIYGINKIPSMYNTETNMWVKETKQLQNIVILLLGNKAGLMGKTVGIPIKVVVILFLKLYYIYKNKTDSSKSCKKDTIK